MKHINATLLGLGALAAGLSIPSSAGAQCGTPFLFSGVRIAGETGECECTCVNQATISCDGAIPSSLIACQTGCMPTDERWTGGPAYCEAECLLDATCTSASTPVPCGFAGCEVSPESCDGIDNDGDGQADQGSCSPDDECHNLRGDPVHVGTGAFVMLPQVDVRFGGSDVPIEFVRYYSSQGRRVDSVEHPDALGMGWSSTLAEGLFASDGRTAAAAPSTSGVELAYVHRDASGAGRTFRCPPPHSPSSAFECTTNDGSLDVLTWTPGTPSRWHLRRSDLIRVELREDGRLHRHSTFDGLQWWEVTYDATLRPIRVDDHLGRYVTFTWSASTPSRLAKIVDSTGSTLATYFHDPMGLQLTEVDTATVHEHYVYASMSVDGATIRLPYIEQILRGGVVAFEISYDYDAAARNVGLGRVRSITEPHGDFAFRYAGDPRNTCDPLAIRDRSSMIIDRSTGPLGASCSDDEAGDDYCVTANGGEAAACYRAPGAPGGSCYAATCQEFLTVSTSPLVVDFSSATAIGGNCGCGGGDEFTYQAASGEYPRRVLTSSDRSSLGPGGDGVLTSYAYDSLGRMIAQCVNDTDATVSQADPSTCPVSGRWTAWGYGTLGVHVAHRSQVTYEWERSSLVTGGIVTTAYGYDPVSGRLLTTTVEGHTRSLTDANQFEDRTTTYQYSGPYGSLSATIGPNGERTDYEYWPSGSGASTGMLRYSRERVGTATLTTTFSSYTSLGRPQSMVEPSGATRSFAYLYQGMVLSSMTFGGLTTGFQYDGAGRLAQVTEPTGRRVVTTYGAMGRVAREDVFDSPSSGEAQRTTYTYDGAGRRTRVQLQRVSSTGSVIANASDLQATYDRFGNTATLTQGPRSPVSFTYDPGALGYLDQITRGDGDVEHFDQDQFGRESFARRTFITGSTGEHNFTFANPSGVETGAPRPTQVQDPLSRTRSYVYDDFGQLVRSSSVEWGTIRWEWDHGRLRYTQWADGRRTYFQYDQTGRLTLIDNDYDAPANIGQDFRFYYDNGDGLVTCPSTSPMACNYREGHLARVQIEASPGAFWEMYYDYTAWGATAFERWPGGNYDAIYTYDAQGRLQRMRYPASSADSLRYTYDSTAGDATDPAMVVAVTGERTGVGDYLYWARQIQRDVAGRMTGVRTHDFTATGLPSTVSYKTDGRVACMRAARRSGASSIGMMDRCYTYSADGSALTHDSIVSGDAERRFFYDGANRLTCSTSDRSAATCPTGSTLIESYAYNAADDRLSMSAPAGTTTYTYNGGPALWDEYPPGRTIYYQPGYGSTGGSRAWDREVTSGSPANQRSYVYDAQGRLRTVTLYRPAGSTTTQQQHTLTILYDHRSRPIYVSDLNHATSVQSRWQFFYDLQNRLINRIETPNTSALLSYTRSSYVYLEPLLIGELQYTSTPLGSSETYQYHATSPEGLPQTGWSFNRTTYATSETWRAQYTPFGRRLSLTPSSANPPPQRFVGQLELPRSDATWWTGSTTFVSREPLSLNGWRALDARAGQYLQVDPYVGEGEVGPNGQPDQWQALEAHPLQSNPYAYASLQPADRVDPDGRQCEDIKFNRFIGCRRTGGERTGPFGSRARCEYECTPYNFEWVCTCDAPAEGGYRDPPPLCPEAGRGIVELMERRPDCNCVRVD